MGDRRLGETAQRRGPGGFIAVGIALTAFAFLYRAVRSGRSADFDHRATISIQRRKHPWFNLVMNLVSWPGFPPQSRIIPWLLPIGWLISGRKLEALFQFLGWGTGFISFMVKRSMKRPRPDHPDISVTAANIGGTSFPSGHVIIYVGVYGTLALLLTRNRPVTALRKAIAAICAALIVLVGPSRMYLGHHFLTDITASYLLGGSYVFLLMQVYDRVRAKIAATG